MLEEVATRSLYIEQSLTTALIGQAEARAISTMQSYDLVSLIRNRFDRKSNLNLADADTRAHQEPPLPPGRHCWSLF